MHNSVRKADWSTGSERTEAGRTAPSHEARKRGTPPATTKAHGQVPSNNGPRVQHTREAHKTRKEPPHGSRCQVTPNLHTTNPTQDLQRSAGGTTNRNARQHPSQEWRGAPETRTRAKKPTLHTQARTGVVQAKQKHKHTRPNTAARSGRVEAKNQTYTHAPQTPARIGGVQAERARKHTHLNTPARNGRAQPQPEPEHTCPHRTTEPGMLGYKRGTQTQPNTPAKNGGVQVQRAQNTPVPKPGLGMAGRTGNRHPSTHSHPAHPSEDWRGAGRERTQRNTPQHPSQDRRGDSQNENPQTRTTNPSQKWRRTGGERIQTHTAEHASQEWRGSAETRTQAHAPTPHTRARNCGQHVERAQENTHPNRPGRNGGVQAERAQKHMNPTPQPGKAGRSRHPHRSTHIHTAHPSQDSPAAGRAHTQSHMPEHPSQDWRGASRNPNPHARTTNPSQDWRGTRRVHTEKPPGQQPSQEWRDAARNLNCSTHTHTAHPGPDWQSERQNPYPDKRTTNPRKALSRTVGGPTQRHTPQSSRQEWPGAAETRAQAHTPTPHIPTRTGRVQEEIAQKDPHPSQEWRGEAEMQTHTTHPIYESLGAAETRAQTHAPQAPGRIGGVIAKPRPKHKRYKTVGKPVSMSRALRQPVLCRWTV